MTLNCPDLTDINRTFYLHDAFTKTEYILGHKTSHNKLKFKRIEIIQYILNYDTN